MHEREREVEPALHAARVAADLAVGRVGQPDALEQLVAARAALRLRQALERRLQPHVLAAGQQRVERGLLQRGADRRRARAAPSRTMSWPATRAVPAVGGSSVVSISTVVDLPAPLGPRKP